MIALKKDYKTGVSLKISLTDDLWYLSHIIAPGDEIISKSERKVKIGSPDGNMRVVRKTVVLTLFVESVSLNEEGDQIRVKGKVSKGPEDVPIGSYHTFGLGLDDSFTLRKSSWPSYVREKLDDAIKNNARTLLFVLFDKEQVIFSLVRQTGISHLSHIKINSQKKQFSNAQAESVYDIIIKELSVYDAQIKPSTIVFASPAFWQKYVKEKLSDQLKKKSLFIELSTIHKGAVHSLLSRPELNSLMSSHRLQKEEKFLSSFLKKLDHDLVAYGLKDILEASNSGSILDLAVTEKFVKKAKEEEFYDSLDNLLKTVDRMKGNIHFIHSEEVMKPLDGFGGIVAILRWK